MSDMFAMEVENDTAVMHLIPILDMAISEEFLMSLRECCSVVKNLTLDAGEVERISTPCVQVLLAAAAEVEGRGGVFFLKNVSAGFERGMCDLGLHKQLETWSKI